MHHRLLCVLSRLLPGYLQCVCPGSPSRFGATLSSATATTSAHHSSQQALSKVLQTGQTLLDYTLVSPFHPLPLVSLGGSRFLPRGSHFYPDNRDCILTPKLTRLVSQTRTNPCTSHVTPERQEIKPPACRKPPSKPIRNNFRKVGSRASASSPPRMQRLSVGSVSFLQTSSTGK